MSPTGMSASMLSGFSILCSSGSLHQGVSIQVCRVLLDQHAQIDHSFLQNIIKHVDRQQAVQHTRGNVNNKTKQVGCTQNSAVAKLLEGTGRLGF